MTVALNSRVVENLARFLVEHQRAVDMVLNEQCYPSWDESSDTRKESVRRYAVRILQGEVYP